jgi:hypothetical protein
MSEQHGAGGTESQQPTEEEMRAALEEELRRVRVEQVVTEATVSILNVAVLRAGLVPGSEGERDLDQTRVGIEAVRALLPLVEQALGAEQARPIRDALSQLQMAYVRAVGSEPSPDAADRRPAPEQQTSREEPAEGPGPAQRSGRLWVPGQ